MEEKLAEALTSFKNLEEGQFIRRSNTRWVWLEIAVVVVTCLLHIETETCSGC